jgi:hypothetical protein
MIGHDAPTEITWRGRRTIHCHLVADTVDELHTAAGDIGLARNWYQVPGEVFYPHYDVISKRLVERTCRLVPLLEGRELIAMAKRCREDAAR